MMVYVEDMHLVRIPRVPFRKESQSKGILDLIHYELCRPMTVTSLGGYNYYVTFINDHS